MDADTDDEAEVLFRAKLQRQDADNPWGFRLQGGADFDKPLTLLKVVEGSIASKAGLQPGDIVFKLAGGPAGSMTHKDAQEAIRQSANSLEIIVGRSEEKAISIQSSEKTTEVKPVDATAQVEETKEPEQRVPVTNNHVDPKKPEPAAKLNSMPVVNHNSTKLANEVQQPNAALPAQKPQVSAPVEVQQNVSAPVQQPTTSTPVGQSKEGVPMQVQQANTSIPVQVQPPQRSLPVQQASTSIPVKVQTPQRGSPVQEASTRIPVQVQPPQRSIPVQPPNTSIPVQVQPPQRSIPVQPASTSIPVQVQQPQVSLPQQQPKVNVPVQVQQPNVSLPMQVQPPKVSMSVQQPDVSVPVQQQKVQEVPSPVKQGIPVTYSEPVANSVPRTVAADLPVKATPLDLGKETAPPIPPIPPTVEVTPPSDPAPVNQVTKTKTRRQRRAMNDIPSGDIPSKQINGSTVKVSEPNNVSTVEMVIPKIQRPATDATNLLVGVSEEKLLTTADRRSGSSSPRNSSSPRLPSSPKLPSSPRASPLISWQQFLTDEKKITNIPVSHERSSSDTTLPLFSPDTIPLHFQNEASRVHNEATMLQQHPGQYSMVDLYPWRRPRASSVDNSAGVTRTRHIPVFIAPQVRDIRISTAERETAPQREIAPPLEQMKTEPMKPSLKLVGRRIESDMTPAGYASDTGSYAGTFPTIAEAPTQKDYSTLGLEDIYFSAASPDLVDIPMPAVKEMVADLNRRLEAIAAQHPKLAEMAPEFGVTYEKKENEAGGAGKDNSSSSSEEEMREIFINSPPSDLDLIRAKMLGLENYEAMQRLYDSQSLSPGKTEDLLSSALKQSRRVHFADPPEQSVIEIEPRHRRPRRRPNSVDTTTLDLSSPSASFSPTSYSSPLVSESSLSSTYLPSQSFAPSSISQPPFPASSISQPSYSGSSTASQTAFTASSITQPPFAVSSINQQQPVAGLYSQQPGDASVDQFASYQPPPRLTSPPSQGQVNISITHRKGEQSGKQYSFTMPHAQPGQPTRFHYTISGKQPVDPFTLSYSIPPSYEESMRNRGINTSQFRSRDDTFLPSPSPRFASPIPYQRSPTPESFNLQHIRSYSPSASPTRMTSPTDRGSPQAIQSKSFKVLEATLQDQPDNSGGNGPEPGRPNPMRVEVLGHPREVLHPVAISRPFVPSSSPPMAESPVDEMANFSLPAQTPPPEAGHGSRPSSQLGLAFPFPASHPLATLGLPPGVIALFDRDFTERVLQWQNQRRSHFESETYKLVREMDNDKRTGNQ